MRTRLIVLLWLALLGFVPSLAHAGSVVLIWDPVAGATSYDIQQSVDGGATWTTPAVLTNLLPALCTGTPASCKVTYLAPAIGTVFFRFVAKNAVGSTTRFDAGVWHCQSCAPPLAATGVGVQ